MSRSFGMTKTQDGVHMSLSKLCWLLITVKPWSKTTLVRRPVLSIKTAFHFSRLGLDLADHFYDQRDMWLMLKIMKQSAKAFHPFWLSAWSSCPLNNDRHLVVIAILSICEYSITILSHNWSQHIIGDFLLMTILSHFCFIIFLHVPYGSLRNIYRHPICTPINN